MADSKIRDLTAETNPANTAIIEITIDPSGTPASRKLALLDLIKALNVMVGDSGLGGTKGLVPAPGAGDGAAGKYLDAAGGYTVPPGTGLTTEQVQDIIGALFIDNSDLDLTYDDGAPSLVATIKPGAAPLSPATVTLTDGGTITWATAGARQNNARVTLGGNRTLDITGEVDGATGLLIVKQDGTGGRSLTLPGSSIVINDGGGAVALSTGANEIDILTWYFDGTNFFWTIGTNYT